MDDNMWTWKGHPDLVAKALKTIDRDVNFDFTLVSEGGREIRAHKFVLKTYSAYFKDKIYVRTG